MNKQFIIFLFIAFSIGLLLGITMFVSFKSETSVDLNSNQVLEIKKTFIQELRQKGILLPAPEIIIDIYGKVSAIKDNKLTIVLGNRFEDPLEEFLPKIMTININEKTEIFKTKEKPFNVFKQEQKKFEQTIREYGDEIPDGLIPPGPFEKIKMEISDIKQGDIIYASSETDFKGKSEFTAASIRIKEMTEIEKNPGTLVE